MFDNLGFHFEYFDIFSIILFVLGAIAGYGAKTVLKLFTKNPTEKQVLILKFLGLIFVIVGMIMIFI